MRTVKAERAIVLFSDTLEVVDLVKPAFFHLRKAVVPGFASLGLFPEFGEAAAVGELNGFDILQCCCFFA